MNINREFLYGYNGVHFLLGFGNVGFFFTANKFYMAGYTHIS